MFKITNFNHVFYFSPPIMYFKYFSNMPEGVHTLSPAITIQHEMSSEFSAQCWGSLLILHARA